MSDVSFDEHVAKVQSTLAASVAKSGLQKDAYRHVIEALETAVGLFPDLVRHLHATRQPVGDAEMRRAVSDGISNHGVALVRVLAWRNVLLGVGIGVIALSIGAGAGYWLRGAAPVLIGVRAGAETCTDRTDGSRLCWVPVFERLPVAKP